MTPTLTNGADAQRATSSGGQSEGRPTIVLVHGAWADGSGWEGVYRLLRKDGYAVRVVQNPTTSLADDVAATRRVLADVQGDVILVGHSWGGAVITEAGNDPRVTGLVYVAGWVPDKGESVEALLKDPVPGASPPPILPPRDGFLLLDPAKFPAAFAGDVKAETAEFMAVAQIPWTAASFTGALTTAAWRTKPSWYLLAKDDRMIPPPLQRRMADRARMTTVESPGSHAVFISRPKAVADLIVTAAKQVQRTAAR